MNGILTDELTAQNNSEKLKRLLGSEFLNENLDIKVGYNRSHLEGLGDFVQSTFQAFNAPISDYDLKTILMQIHPEVTTQKILLVGHSQGTFYTNELYDYFINHGVPRESIGVYNIATPSSFVAGAGSYVTSSNDKLINWIRDTEVHGNVRIAAESYNVVGSVVSSALRANITIPPEAEWASSNYGGHGFSVYLDGAATRISKDIQAALGKLKALPRDGVEGCFEAPATDFTYRAKSALFAAGDSLANSVASAGAGIKTGTLALGGFLSDAYAALVSDSGVASSAGQASAAAVAVTPTTNEPNQASQSSQVIPVPPTKPREAVPPPAPPSNSPPPAVSPPPQQPAPIPPAIVGLIPGQGGWGGGGSAVQASQTSSAQGGGTNDASDSGTSTTPISTSSPSIFTVQTPPENALLHSNTVSFTGQAAAAAEVTADYNGSTASTSADSLGHWSINLSLPEGDAEVLFSDDSLHSIARRITIDTVPPDAPTATIAACAHSLAPTFCLVPITNVSLEWTPVTDAAYYGITHDEVLAATTTETTGSLVVPNGATSTLAVVAYDAAGNAATSTAHEVVAITHPLIINEVGWGGTVESTSNQWIELKNITGHNLRLDDVAIARTGAATPIQITGTLPSGNSGYVVVARESTAFMGSHTLLNAFTALSTTSAEQLSLVWNGTTILDSTPAVTACAIWCAGGYNATLGTNVSGKPNLVTSVSMERVGDDTDGTQASSWRTTDSYATYLGIGGSLWGTAGERNSAGYPDAGVSCGTSSLVEAGQPYNPDDWVCTYFMKFITGGANGSTRFGGLYRGISGSSTPVNGHSFTKSLANSAVDTANNPTPDEPFFFAIWEQRSGDAFNSDTFVFNFFFTKGASSTQGISGPPHGNYVLIPWTFRH